MQAESSGVVVRGHRVASGANGDPRFPGGTIALQLPLFRARLPELDAHLGGEPFAGTVNLQLAGARIVPGIPEVVLREVRWTDRFAPETFFLSRAEWEHAGVRRPAWLYIPDPATKPGDHPARADVIELLTLPVPGLAYGDPALLRYCPAELIVTAG